ncbi:glycoside hydrolase superfamily [Lipomyces kononenkoae]|uniref:Glycoside hydrolase superfamily n=1 Tax=Lipomyces kononenkoae TaxID=34357 RepID=A0ACC3SUJ1_LIPKO
MQVQTPITDNSRDFTMVSELHTTVSTEVCFQPAPGEVVFAELVTGTAFDIYAISNRPDARIHLSLSSGSPAAVDFKLIKIPSIGGGYYTFKASVDVPEKNPLNITYSYTVDDTTVVVDRAATIIPRTCQAGGDEFRTVIELPPGQDRADIAIPWISINDWQGWVWVRPRNTWIEPRWITLKDLPILLGSHFFLLQPVNPAIDPASSFCIYPCSSGEATVHLTSSRDGEKPNTVYARVRRTKADCIAKVYIVGKVTTRADVFESMDGAIGMAKEYLGTSNLVYEMPPSHDRGTLWPHSQLGFCTWSSIGEYVRPTNENLERLVQSLKDADLPIGSFIIDDGWQDIRKGMNGIPETTGLWSFEIWDGMNISFRETVDLIKRTIPTVENVGVWMTLHGYWNSIASKSPLVAKYKMRPYKLSRDCVPGLIYKGFEMQTCTQPDEKDYVWWLPPKELAYQFWKDYFSVCAAAGITFAKVDDQAYCSFLAGVEGAEEAFALWDGMNKAADEIFGEGRVIHCMAHYERMFNGDIGMGLPTNGKKVVFRNTNDFGLPRPNVHRDHIHYNLMNCMIISRMCLIPDADMFMSAAQWPEYHAVLRAFFQGPVLLSDRAGEHDLEVIHKLIGRTRSGVYEVIRAPNTIRPIRSRIWEPTLASGIGPSIKAVSSFPVANAASIILWSSRDSAAHASTDILYASDVIDALGSPTLLPDTKYLLWFSNHRSALYFNPLLSSPGTPIAEITLPPKTHDIITIVPSHVIGGEDGIEVACLGLIDKYASLAPVMDIEVLSEPKCLRTTVTFEGKLAFVANTVDSTRIRVLLNSEPVPFQAEVLDGLGASLLTVAVNSGAGERGTADSVGWTVDVCWGALE